VKGNEEMTIRFDGQVAIVTGAGNGLGRSHALELARRGAKVVVNDLGGSKDGQGASSDAAKSVVAEIEALGGEAIANGANVTNYEQVEAMVKQAVDTWGRVDVLINNAGILRDKSFSKMELADFNLVLDVHLLGSVNCTKAVWGVMKEQQYGRIVMTTSSSGMYGNFGQANYGAAKMGVIGLMNTLVIEGLKDNIRVNCLAPGAGTRMTEGLVDKAVFDLMTVESVTAGAVSLCHSDAPNRLILNATAGSYSVTKLVETQGIYLKPEDQSADNVAANLEALLDSSDAQEIQQGGDHVIKMVSRAGKALGLM
jgi:NAD(P)-dependent dehydrogenase (short-subunit alcohol dehydrogenase family)